MTEDRDDLEHDTFDDLWAHEASCDTCQVSTQETDRCHIGKRIAADIIRSTPAIYTKQLQEWASSLKPKGVLRDQTLRNA